MSYSRLQGGSWASGRPTGRFRTEGARGAHRQRLLQGQILKPVAVFVVQPSLALLLDILVGERRQHD